MFILGVLSSFSPVALIRMSLSSNANTFTLLLGYWSIRLHAALLAAVRSPPPMDPEMSISITRSLFLGTVVYRPDCCYLMDVYISTRATP